MEPCSTYKPWHDKQTGRTFLKPDDGKCLHYYFYFIDEELGLCYVRVPTWLPCRLQIYFNGHNWLASALEKRKIDLPADGQCLCPCLRLDTGAADRRWAWDRTAASQAGCIRAALLPHPSQLRRELSLERGPVANTRPTSCSANKPIFNPSMRTSAAPPSTPSSRINIATFLGKKLVPQFEGEMGNRFNVRIEGTRIKHTMGRCR